jgi:hypothetical protein
MAVSMAHMRSCFQRQTAMVSTRLRSTTPSGLVIALRGPEKEGYFWG